MHRLQPEFEKLWRVDKPDHLSEKDYEILKGLAFTWFITGRSNLDQRIASLEQQLADANRWLEWQPIETAPRDGTFLCLGHRGKPFICNFENGVAYRQSWSKRIYWLTHWMPLPSPPESKQDDEKEDRL